MPRIRVKDILSYQLAQFSVGIGQFFKSLLEGGKVDIASRYEILREAVSGTMSNFHMARDRETDKIVGLKDPG